MTEGKVYMMIVRPAMMYGLKIVTLTKRQEVEQEVAELKIFECFCSEIAGWMRVKRDSSG